MFFASGSLACPSRARSSLESLLISQTGTCPDCVLSQDSVRGSPLNLIFPGVIVTHDHACLSPTRDCKDSAFSPRYLQHLVHGEYSAHICEVELPWSFLLENSLGWQSLCIPPCSEPLTCAGLRQVKALLARALPAVPQIEAASPMGSLVPELPCPLA